MGNFAEFRSEGFANDESLRARAAVSQLAPIEQAILLGVANGESVKGLAEKLQIPVTAIEARKSATIKKLNAFSTADAVRIALLAGMDGRMDRTTPR